MPVLLHPPDVDLSSDDEIFVAKKKRLTYINSDESDDDDLRDRNVRVRVDEDVELSDARILLSDEDILEREEKERIALSNEPKRNLKYLFADKDLYDAESSDDEPNSGEKTNSLLQLLDTYDAEGSSDEASKPPTKQKTAKKHHENKSTKSAKVKETKKLKEPKDEADLIHSETQRIVRQSRVSLPYHKPRQRNILDFLQRRPSVPAKSLRMSVDELELLGKHVEKRVKEAEEFYKSSSDEDVSFKETGGQKVAEQDKAFEESNEQGTAELKENGDVPMESGVKQNVSGQLSPKNLNDELSSQNIYDQSSMQNNSVSLLVQNTSLACENKVEGVLEQVSAADEDSRCSKLNVGSDVIHLNEEESQALVLKLDDTGTCEFLEKRSEEPVAEIDKVSEALKSEDETSGARKRVNESVGKSTPSFMSILNSEDIDTQDLRLHLTESETSDLLNPNPLVTKNICTKTSSLETSSAFPSYNEEESTLCAPHKSFDDSETMDDMTNLKLILRDDETSCSLGQDSGGRQIINARSRNDPENPEIILEGEDAASMSLLQTKSQRSEISNRKNDNDFVFQIPKLNESSRDKHPFDLSNLVDVKDEIEEKKSVNFLKDIGNFKLVPPNFKILNTAPRLKGSPSEVVDLDETPSPGGIKAFMQRFMKHSVPITPKVEKNKTEVLSIITAEKGENGEHEVKKDSVTIIIENDMETKARLQELKEELQQNIVKQKEEERNKKQLETQEENIEEREEDEKSECGLLDEEEMEDYVTSSSSEEEEEEELEEDDIEIKEKKNVKCAFVDDEAEEEDDSDDPSLDVPSENDDDNDDDTSVNKDGEEEEEGMEDINKKNEDPSKPPDGSQRKKLKRIKTIDPFLSDDSSNEGVEFETSLTPGIPPYQPGGAVSQVSEAVEEEQFLPNIIAPTLPTQVPARTFPENDNETSEIIFSHPSQTSGLLAGLGIQTASNNDDIEDAELLDLCSGKFTSQLPPISQDEELDASNSLPSTLPIETQDDSKPSLSISSTVSKQLTLSKNTLSQSLGKETESKTHPFFKLKEKEVKVHSFFKKREKKDKEQLHQKMKEISKEDPLSSLGMRILGSSDEEDVVVEKRPKKNHKKAHKKLNFSDDESDGFEYDDDNSEKFGSDFGDPLDVDYDSEENEITKEVKNFFEDEAELSESEWGSADEDEKDLDDIEVEAGDDENIDQDQLKEQLGKIHMRRVLDEDQEEVRRLQELLLEDGEFHSDTGGRQRQFRWKNLNNVDDLNYTRQSDEEDGIDENEVEDEEEWRKQRFERESFLQEQEKETKEERALIEEAIKLKLKRATPIQPRVKVQQRGSFLARSEAALARIAQLTLNASDANINGPTNSRNFVFATLSEEEKAGSAKQAVKRKATIQEEMLKKKIRVSEGLLDKIIY